MGWLPGIVGCKWGTEGDGEKRPYKINAVPPISGSAGVWPAVKILPNSGKSQDFDRRPEGKSLKI
jgi:hypothetical protein